MKNARKGDVYLAEGEIHGRRRPSVVAISVTLRVS